MAEDRKHCWGFLNIIMNKSREFIDQLNHYQFLKNDWSMKLGLMTCFFEPVDCL